MWMLVIGFLLALLKFADINPVASWPWWVVLMPFAMIIVWWEVIERVFGLREKREKAKVELERKERAERLYGKKK